MNPDGDTTMQVPPEIAFRNVEPTPPVERAIEEGIAQLNEIHDRITSCRLMVELPHRRHRRGNLYRVRIDLTVPGAEIVVSRAPLQHTTSEEVVTAIAEAFEIARMRLIERVGKLRAEQRSVEPPPLGRVIKLVRHEGYGFLESVDGREVYFHRNAVRGRGYNSLEVGQDVRFSEGEGEKGPQASAVIPKDSGGPLPADIGEELGEESPDRPTRDASGLP